ncbi:MAG TPA: hypothetical protein PLK94_11905 [Alphaproteobacteria bacterium]|nr:hypothetical protein [Alphaproteobacteria bacterium]
MDRDRFHNQLALSIGYKLINEKRYTLIVEESNNPIVTLKVQGREDIRFKASDDYEFVSGENQIEINEIVNAVHQAYINANIFKFA